MTWRVPRCFEGQTVVCAATGPSLSTDDLSRAIALHIPIIAVNRVFEICPEASYHYFADALHWERNRDRDEWTAFTGERVTMSREPAEADPSIHLIGNAGFAGGRNDGLSDDPSCLKTGYNSGYQALNLAYLMGAKRILLIGYDFKNGDDGNAHFYPDETVDGRPLRVPEPLLANWARYFASAVPQLRAAGVEVVNCSERSIVAAFPKASLAQALDASEGMRHEVL